MADASPLRVLSDATGRSGAFNMALDSALLESVATGRAPATLRFYAWDPACLSLGYFQPLERHVDVETCRRRGVALVRRVTGGKALLHLPEDLTYSLVLPPGHALMGKSVVESYGLISRAFADALEALGVKGLAFGQERSGGAAGGVCFAEHLVESMLWEGRKFLGSAQLRRHGGLLQHGSLKCRLDVELEGALYAERAGRDRAYWTGLVGETVTSLDEIMGGRPTWEELVEAVSRAMAARLGLEARRGEPTEEEKKRAEVMERAFRDVGERPVP